MADPIAQALAARRQRFYDEQPLINAAVSMPNIQTRRNQNQYVGAAAGVGQALARALMGTQGLNQARGDAAAYDRDFVSLINRPNPIEALAGDERYADVAGMLASQQQQNDMTFEMENRKAEESQKRLMKLEEFKATMGNPLVARQLAQEYLGKKTPGTQPGPAQQQGVAIDPGSPKQARVMKLQRDLESQYGLSTSEAFARAQAMDDGDDKYIADAFGRMEKSVPGQQLADVQGTWKNLLAHKNIDTRSGDIAIISALARMNDPGSTVREGEFAIAQSAAPVFDRYMKEVESTIFGTGRLSQQTRQEMLQSAAQKIGAFQESYNAYANNVMSGLQGYDPERLKTVTPFSIRDPGEYAAQLTNASSPMASPAAQPNANMPQAADIKARVEARKAQLRAEMQQQQPQPSGATGGL